MNMHVSCMFSSAPAGPCQFLLVISMLASPRISTNIQIAIFSFQIFRIFKSYQLRAGSHPLRQCTFLTLPPRTYEQAAWNFEHWPSSAFFFIAH
ncbi:hypothetical protein K503DRAFT_356848 [Rhizopogon vinicolor AM-OR11-026]|uniref:Uncharacterized protein n=1 Tax=Rhizopogon vinicolor AM-OR11-026 TaxID=1314800 RepID=A0A1B7MSP5_9AGAM|nr:hypothetical protein K503DRAFT_356848 [Rhizopogon vinicolor AM-OR11-026]